ncbi:uncharacterized protein N7518_001846 [Penicillium psychrosexuale]|uniref:uncharacterized protein n=1 Tax=Penicillium psychrosexuale TaxID=1002107 RepID=UPI002545BB75|nr:uncharacterized protein N7518_001846 [Penicillium psychrosexuale]KAJ5799778.1 hypothetical protein N7518_001846 [Penicillium psychrosexuale]
MIPIPNVYCPLCGVILLPDPYSDDDLAFSHSRVRPWYAEVRGLYSINATASHITTTGLGIVRYRNILYAPLGSGQSYVDVDTEALEEWRLFGSSVSRWCFGFHDSCWKLLLLRLARGPGDAMQSEATISKSVFYQLYCTPCIQASIFHFGHDYEGAAQTHKSFGLPQAVDLSSKFYADPCAIPSPMDLETTAPESRKVCDTSLWNLRDSASPSTATAAGIDCHSEEDTAASGPFRPNDNCDLVPSPDTMTKQICESSKRPQHSIFDGLSLELKFEIFSYLSFGELLNVRLVCRDLAQLAAVDILPRSYWRSRFLLGQEADFLLLDVTDTQDWYLLFFGTRASLTIGTLSLVNRKRIRQLLEPIAALVDLDPVLRNGPYGSAVQPAQNQCEYYQLIDDQSAETPPRLIEVSTNYGRTATFAALHHRLNAAVELIPISPPSNTITGLAAFEMQFIKQIQAAATQTQVTLTCFERVGIQSQQCGIQPSIPDILDCECHEIPDNQLRYDEKFSHFIYSRDSDDYQTYASLKNVRKIHASTGIQGQSRSRSRISGLKLEYYGHPSPGIVGQWMHQLDDGFELSQDEEVQSLTIWLVPVGFSSASPGLEIGQVAAIHIKTTSSRSVTFRPPDFQSISSQKLQCHQYQGDSDEKLTAISWILNLSSERVRAVISTNGSRPKAVILVPEQVPPFDQVRKLYFERRNNKGCRETIVTAEAYFKDQAIVGLVFVYNSGKTASTGELDTETRQAVHFAPDARIVGLSVAATEHKLVEIEFEVERNEQPSYEKLRLSADLPHELARTIHYTWRKIGCKDEASADNYPRPWDDRVYEAPSGSRLIGIYMRCQEFCCVGALYELDVSE